MNASMLGQAACLVAALLWAVAVTLFRRPVAVHGARTINLAKCVLATVLLAATAGAGSAWHDLVSAPATDLVLLALSGLLGLTLGDSALFAAVTRIGVHRTLLLLTTAPVFTALLALPMGERLSMLQLGGGVLILVGVALVVVPGGRSGQVATVAGSGLLLGLVAALGQGSGVVVAKAGMSVVPVLPATLLRLAAASTGLAVVAAVRGELARVVAAVTDLTALRRVVPATILGTYLAMLMMMAGIAAAPASIAAVLLATTPVFSLILEAAVDRRWPALSGVVGTIVAVVGVAILTGG